jgi:hypothetical protein
MASELEVRSTRAGLWFAAHDCCCFANCRTPWYRIAVAEGAGRRPEPDGAQVLVAPYGPQPGLVPEGYAVKGGRLVLPDGRGIALARKHAHAAAVPSVLVDGAGKQALVLSVVNACDCSSDNEGSFFYFVLSRVDLAAGRAEAIREGEGSAALGADGAGAVYLQTGEGTRRWPAMSAVGREAGEAVMTGVWLTPPRGADPNCCGL